MPINYESFQNISLATRFIHGAFWSLAGTVAGRVATFLGAVIAARFLGQAGFGELAMIQSTIGLLGTIAGFGIGMTATRYVAELRSTDPQRTGRIIAFSYLISWVMGGIMALITVLAAPWLAVHTINAPHLAGELRLASILLLLTTILGPQMGILAGCQAFRAIAYINWGQGLVGLPLIVTLVWLAGLRGVICALILTVSLGGLLASLSLAREYQKFDIKLNFRQALLERPILWQFSLPMLLGGILHGSVMWGANAMLANQPQGYSELGLFNATMQFYFLIIIATNILASVSVPMLAEIYGQNNPELFSRVFNVQLKLVWSSAIALGCLALGLSPWLIQIFGAKYFAARSILPITICFTMLVVALNIMGQAFYTTDRVWLGFLNTLLMGVVFILSVHILVPLYGALGLAFSYLIAYFIELILRIILLKYILRQIVIKDILIPFIFCILVIASVLFGKSLLYSWQSNIIFVGLAFFIVYTMIKYNLSLFDGLLFNYFGWKLIKS